MGVRGNRGAARSGDKGSEALPHAATGEHTLDHNKTRRDFVLDGYDLGLSPRQYELVFRLISNGGEAPKNWEGLPENPWNLTDAVNKKSKEAVGLDLVLWEPGNSSVRIPRQLYRRYPDELCEALQWGVTDGTILRTALSVATATRDPEARVSKIAKLLANPQGRNKEAADDCATDVLDLMYAQAALHCARHGLIQDSWKAETNISHKFSGEEDGELFELHQLAAAWRAYFQDKHGYTDAIDKCRKVAGSKSISTPIQFEAALLMSHAFRTKETESRHDHRRQRTDPVTSVDWACRAAWLALLTGSLLHLLTALRALALTEMHAVQLSGTNFEKRKALGDETVKPLLLAHQAVVGNVEALKGYGWQMMIAEVKYCWSLGQTTIARTKLDEVADTIGLLSSQVEQAALRAQVAIENLRLTLFTHKGKPSDAQCSRAYDIARDELAASGGWNPFRAEVLRRLHEDALRQPATPPESGTEPQPAIGDA